jgi:hypothetical protein
MRSIEELRDRDAALKVRTSIRPRIVLGRNVLILPTERDEWKLRRCALERRFDPGAEELWSGDVDRIG